MPLPSSCRADTALKLCPHCDAAYRRLALVPGERAYCQRCGTELYRNNDRRYPILLPIVLASLIVYVICNAFPIVTMEIQGVSTQTTVWGAVRALAQEDMFSVALLVLATTMLFPLLELGLLAYLLVPLSGGRVPAGFGAVVRVVRLGRPWGMIEVFMLGIVASLVKLSAMATVIPGPALWAFGVLTVLLAIVVSFDPADLWEYAESVEKADRVRMAEEAR
ncbi:paraquat-inducible membrane protein A [Pigmentiphaga sp. NML080357]|uniref:paraquat-inducible protein A n=1 Tax=Pigmentiphaga sp. NML080357 TaxID=2008675 RepID=UPI000B41F062|nr:paraquat-inducible protein A [Pigmentiphaga sp. NML080357]OVZ57266.1 paraquat-inducible membrane protein A [Pigmentiphaga sp. NML080357]